MRSPQNPYREFAASYAKLAQQGKAAPLGGLSPAPKLKIPADAPEALFFAPHPDDESIMGGLALRLLRQSRWNITNVAVTLGSKPERRDARFEELKGACHFLGFGLAQAGPLGLDKVTARTREKEPAAWATMVKTISKILANHRPRAIFFPHEADWNQSHIGTHFLVMDAVRETRDLACWLVETEFWGQMPAPNLLVEYSADEVGDLIAATSFHAGEVRRNPYHLAIPAWMQDNVRRGAELVGGQGAAAPPFLFGQLFRLRRWSHGAVEAAPAKGQFFPAAADPASLFA